VPTRIGEVLGVHGSEQLVVLDTVVEAADELGEERCAADTLVERWRCRHAAKLRGRRLLAARV
jgi:hypothetical protein